MQDAWRIWEQSLDVLREGLRLIVLIVSTVWEWTGGQIVRASRHFPHIDAIPHWKQILLAGMTITLIFLLSVIALDLWTGVRRILDAILALLRTIIDRIVFVIVMLLITVVLALAINHPDTWPVSWLISLLPPWLR